MQARKELIVEPVGIEVEDLPRPIDWAAMFGNDNPVEVEIGCGKGSFLTGQATRRKDVNFFGVEWARWFWRYTSDRLRRNGCADNARTSRAEARWFMDECVPPASVSVLHVYFPDPWPKARHNKRRLIQPSFMPIVERALVPGGRLQVVTDHADYWEQIEPTIDGSDLERVEYVPLGAGDGEVAGTNFERKYIEQGRAFHAIAAVRD